MNLNLSLLDLMFAVSRIMSNIQSSIEPSKNTKSTRSNEKMNLMDLSWLTSILYNNYIACVSSVLSKKKWLIASRQSSSFLRVPLVLSICEGNQTILVRTAETYYWLGMHDGHCFVSIFSTAADPPFLFLCLWSELILLRSRTNNLSAKQNHCLDIQGRPLRWVTCH